MGGCWFSQEYTCIEKKAQPTFTVRKVTSQSCEKVQQQDLIGEFILEKAQQDV